MKDYIEILTSIYLFAFFVQIILLGFTYHRMVHPKIAKFLTGLHSIFLISSIMAMVFDGFKNPYFITFVVSVVGFVVGVCNDKEEI
jgi:hypothetical protein